MKTLRMPAVVLAALCLGFLVCLACSVPVLPQHMAVHFAAGGQPNGWMNRSTHLLLMGAFGLGLPLVSVVFGLGIRSVQARFISLPHREYWLSPERQSQTYAYIFRQLLWLACMEVVFFGGVQLLIVEANGAAPVRLPVEKFLPLLGCFVAAVALWAILLIYHFAKAAPGGSGADDREGRPPRA